MAPKRRRRYVGELAHNIVRPAFPSFEGAVTEERVQRFWRKCNRHEREAERRIRQKRLQKMLLLMKHYQIADENDIMALALALASQHVPGFKVVPESDHRSDQRRIDTPSKSRAARRRRGISPDDRPTHGKSHHRDERYAADPPNRSHYSNDARPGRRGGRVAPCTRPLAAMH
jgi:hypothetical protein